MNTTARFSTCGSLKTKAPTSRVGARCSVGGPSLHLFQISNSAAKIRTINGLSAIRIVYSLLFDSLLPEELYSSGLYSNISPGWQLSSLQIASKVENRTALAFPVFRMERLAGVRSIFSASSPSEIFRFAIITSRFTIIGILFIGCLVFSTIWYNGGLIYNRQKLRHKAILSLQIYAETCSPKVDRR